MLILSLQRNMAMLNCNQGRAVILAETKLNIKIRKHNMNINLIAKSLAAVISQTGKFGADEQKMAFGLIAKGSTPEDMAENFARIGNVSAVRQELEKAGLLPVKAADLSAMQRQVKEQLAIITAAAAKK